jgi:hypothetical protein
LVFWKDRTASYYVNGGEVLTGVTGFINYYVPWVSFGGQDSNFNLVELQSDTSITTTHSPEPSSLCLVGLAFVTLAAVLRLTRKRFAL